jgi:preprotein translocase subunit YajC
MKHVEAIPAFKKSLCALLTAALLLPAAPVYGQDSQWKNVSALKPGERVWMKTAKGGRRGLTGKVVAADDNGVTLDLGKKGSKTVSRSDVQEVREYGPRTTTYQTAGMALIAGGAAAELGITLRNVNSLNGSNPSIAYSSLPLWAAVGGLVMVLVKGRPHSIYRK